MPQRTKSQRDNPWLNWLSRPWGARCASLLVHVTAFAILCFLTRAKIVPPTIAFFRGEGGHGGRGYPPTEIDGQLSEAPKVTRFQVAAPEPDRQPAPKLERLSEADRSDEPEAVVQPDVARIAKRHYEPIPPAAVPELAAAVARIEQGQTVPTAHIARRETPPAIPQSTVANVVQPIRRSTQASLAIASVLLMPPSAMPGDGAPGLTNGLPGFDGNAPPEYPPQAIRAGWQGTVTLRLTISPRGEIAKVDVATSSGHLVLDAAAVNAVKNWRATAGTNNGQQVQMTVLYPIKFELP